MMAATYELIASQVLGSAAASVTFSSIPGTFDDLVLVMSARSTRTSANRDAISVYPNSDTSNLSYITLESRDGNIVESFSQSSWRLGLVPTATTSAFGSCEVYFCNYSSTLNKSASATNIHEDNAADGRISLPALLWSNTTAISSLLIDLNIANFATGSSFHLYGITKA